MSMGASSPGFLLLDGNAGIIGYNEEAVRILMYPTASKSGNGLEKLMADRVFSALLDRRAPKGQVEFPKEFKSGRRRYLCRVFRLNWNFKGSQVGNVILLDRFSARVGVVSEISKEYDLTDREGQAVELLVQGLTSKETASRMDISANTVKAFLRLVMVKMGVSTRSGIVGRIIGPPQ